MDEITAYKLGDLVRLKRNIRKNLGPPHAPGKGATGTIVGITSDNNYHYQYDVLFKERFMIFRVPHTRLDKVEDNSW